MSKLIASVAILAALAIGRIAGAAEATGWITHLDREVEKIVLDDGRIFVVSDELNFSSLRDGVKVQIRYNAIEGDKIATEILLLPEEPKGFGPQSSRSELKFCTPQDHSTPVRKVEEITSAIC